MSEERCPFCGVSLQGPPIPEKSQDAFGGATHFSRLISIYDLRLDRTVQYQCPDCGERWPRELGTTPSPLEVAASAPSPTAATDPVVVRGPAHQHTDSYTSPLTESRAGVATSEDEDQLNEGGA